MPSLNRLQLKLDAADSKFLENNSGKHLIVWAMCPLENVQVFGSNS